MHSVSLLSFSRANCMDDADRAPIPGDAVEIMH